MSQVPSIVVGFFTAAFLLPLGLHAQQEGDVKRVTPDTLTFQPFPEEMAAEIAILYGNPNESGHYIVRLKFAPNWDGRPHTHGSTELLTVHSGTCYVAHGDDLSRDAAEQLPAGSFMVVPAGTRMRAFTGEEGCVVDVQGQGPFTTQYLGEDKPKS